MTDELLILLSTDWFLPYWGNIGIVVDDATKNCIHEGSRRIVSKFVGDAQRMFEVDLTDRRKQETRGSVITLLRQCGAEQELSAIFEEWASKTEKDRSTVWNFFNLNQIAVSNPSPHGYPEIGVAIRAKLARVWEIFDFEFAQIRKACLSSTTDWDRRIHVILGGAATLSELLVNALRSRTLHDFWRRLRLELSSEEARTLTAWYRDMTTAMTKGERPDLIPSYVNED